MLETVKLKCGDVRRLLPDYLNGVVDAITSQLMRWHFYECRDCRTIVQSAADTFRENFREDSIRVFSKKRRAA